MSPRFSSLLQRVLLALSLAVALPAFAADIVLTNEAFQDVTVKGKDGKSEKKRQKVTSAVPGSEIIYVITYRNTGSKPAQKVVVNNPIAEGLAFVPGSAQGNGARAEVSVDGKNFGALEALSVKGSGGKSRSAKGADVTQVRWTVLTPVAPGQGGNVTFRAVVK
jgi:uncharacterized repeat protein (TIGR01451 family)